MSVTQNYTIAMSSDAWTYIASAVLTQMRTDRAQVVRLPASGFDAFLVEQIAYGTEALDAMNDAAVLTREDTHSALDGEMLQTVVESLHCGRDAQNVHLIAMRIGKEKYDKGIECCPAIFQSDVDRASLRLERIDKALLFLENPK